MGRVGSALGACAESFFSTLQHELISRRNWHTRRVLPPHSHPAQTPLLNHLG